jgi:putative Ca2+/H+ antiporter (TMEM165/GDT1 family)
MGDLLAAFGLVFLAELGDKSMLLAVAFAVRYRPVPVIAGIATAALTMLGLSVLIGAAIATALPDGVLSIIGGVLFVGFGLWTLRPEDDDVEEARVHSRFVLLTVTGSFLIAEFGDKTMLATITLAGNQAALPTWLGAAAGMTVASV